MVYIDLRSCRRVPIETRLMGYNLIFQDIGHTTRIITTSEIAILFGCLTSPPVHGTFKPDARLKADHLFVKSIHPHCIIGWRIECQRRIVFWICFPPWGAEPLAVIQLIVAPPVGSFSGRTTYNRCVATLHSKREVPQPDCEVGQGFYCMR